MNIAEKLRMVPDSMAWLKDSRLHHVFFWATLYVIFIVIDDGKFGIGFRMVKEAVNIFFYIAIVYFNLIFLIPKYLKQRTFLIYTGLLLILALVLTPIKTLALYFIYSNYPETQLTILDNKVWVFLTGFFAAGASTIFKMLNDWLKHERDRKELMAENFQTELRFLRSQINPHFLFNTLNNLYALTLKKSDKAPEIVVKLSEMMRYMLYECNEKRVPLSKEINYLSNYLDLERLRQGHQTNISYELNGEIEEQKIAPLIFIPFLENSFKHGLKSQIGKSYVDLKIDLDDDTLHFQIENSKPDSLPERNVKSGGIGLVNVRRRLALIYPNAHKLDIQSNPNSYTVYLTLKLN